MPSHPAALPSSRDTSGVELKPCFTDPLLNVMDFLNEVVTRYPAAISFAPGRPLESLLHVEEHLAAASTFVAESARRSGRTEAAVWGGIGQYGRTNGIIGEAIASHLSQDEGINVDTSNLVVTVGAQEAMAIVLVGLFEPARDILVVSDPTYIGITGLARLLGIRVIPVRSDDNGLDPESVEQAIISASPLGRVRALYDIPDFNNPMGTSLSRARRLHLLEVCRRHDVLIIEDNPYGMFTYDHERQRTLMALDEESTVLYIGSFAKTLWPGLRMGYLATKQRDRASGDTLANALSRVKSLLTVNTPALCQAIVAGTLLQSGGSLEPIVTPKRAIYRSHRDATLAALQKYSEGIGDRVSWHSPHGGFFLPVNLPFEFGDAEVYRCAIDYGVIVCPMQMFCLGEARARQVRLSFSYVQPAEIDRGVGQFMQFVRDTIAAQGRSR